MRFATDLKRDGRDGAVRFAQQAGVKLDTPVGEALHRRVAETLHEALVHAERD